MLLRSEFFIVIALSFLTLSCSSQTKEQQSIKTSLSKEIKEIHKGVLEGYLSKNEIPNSLQLVPTPPQEGSAAFKFDQEVAAKYVASGDDDRRKQAAQDAVLVFPQVVDAFNTILTIKISEKNTPHLYMILRRTLADAGLSTYAAKNHYQRKRPFMVNNAPTCTPHEEISLRKDGSYPSGHTAVGWAWALVLTEVFPEQADEILERGKQFGVSRNVCNVHWHSDVIYGRMMGATAVAMLHANTDFIIDLKVAKKEVNILKVKLNQTKSN